MKLNRIFAVLIAILFSSSLFAAGQGEAAGKAQKLKGVVLNALVEGHPTDKAVAKLLPQFEKETGIKVNLEVLPFEEMSAKNYLTISQKSDRYDIFMDNWGNGMGLLSAGGLEPLDAYIANSSLSKYIDMADFVKAYKDMPTYQGHQYGLPMYGESTFLMYRKDVFEKLGIKVPKTMEELRDAAKQVTEKSNGEIYGITMRGAAGPHVISIWSGFLWAFGGHWLTDDDKKADLDTPEAMKATEFYSELLNKYGPPGYANFGWQENRVAFTQGKAAMTIDATVNGAFNEDPKGSVVVGKVGYAPVPNVPGVKQKGGQHSLFVHSLYMNKYSRNKEAAFLFMSWATSAATQAEGLSLEPNSGATSLKAMNSEVYVKNFGAFRDAMLEALKNANGRYVPTIAQSQELYLKVGTAVSEAMTGAKTAAQALREVNNDINTNVLK